MTAAVQPQVKILPKATKDEVIARLNEEYALILLGERPAVLREEIGFDGRPTFRLLSVAGFHEWLRPTFLWEVDNNQNHRKVQASKVWIDSEQRRQYEGLVFDPTSTTPAGYYNLWSGFAVEPSEKGSCQRFLDHVAENVCRGDEQLFAWVIGWFAAMVQFPTEKLGTSLVLRGAQGTGKTIVGKIVGSLLGPHYALVADSRYIVGRFNAHLSNCLLLQLDEATWGGDHAAAGKLKDLITGEWQYIEYKGKEPVRVRNYVRLLVTGNNNWLVPAGLEERRFAVLDMGDDRRQNHAYFQAIEDEMEAGGRATLLHYLQHLDLEEIGAKLRKVPHTAALVEQQVASLAPEQQWWLDVLHRGVLPGDDRGLGETPTHVLYEHYLDRMQRLGVIRKHSETGFGIALRRMVPGILRNRRAITTPAGTDRFWVYELPSLEVCRREFERITGDSDPTSDSTTEWQPWKPKS